MAIDLFNLAAQSFVGGAVGVGRSAVNNLTSSAIGALGGTLTGGTFGGGIIGGIGSIPDRGCGGVFGSNHNHPFGGGAGRMNDPCGKFNNPLMGAIESIGLQGASSAINALGQLALGGTRTGFNNDLSNIGRSMASSAVNAGVNLTVGLGSAAAGTLISSVGNASLSNAGSWLDSAKDAISDWF